MGWVLLFLDLMLLGMLLFKETFPILNWLVFIPFGTFYLVSLYRKNTPSVRWNFLIPLLKYGLFFFGSICLAEQLASKIQILRLCIYFLVTTHFTFQIGENSYFEPYTKGSIDGMLFFIIALLSIVRSPLSNGVLLFTWIFFLLILNGKEINRLYRRGLLDRLLIFSLFLILLTFEIALVKIDDLFSIPLLFFYAMTYQAQLLYHRALKKQIPLPLFSSSGIIIGVVIFLFNGSLYCLLLSLSFFFPLIFSIYIGKFLFILSHLAKREEKSIQL